MAWLRGLLFDLDGVLIDSLPSIAGCMNYALAALGRDPRAFVRARPRRQGPGDRARTRDELEAAGARWIAVDLLALPGLLERIDGDPSA